MNADRIYSRQRPLFVEVLTAVALVAAPFVLEWFDAAPNTVNRILVWGLFGIGAMAAGFAGFINAPIVSLSPEVGEQILVQTFVVVVIGGVGSFPGAILGGLIAGQIISITSMFNPGYAYVMLFVAMTLVLVLRPYGLLGTAGRE